MELYNYFRSSASWRVRIAMALKGLDYDYLPIHLVKKEQSSPEFLALSGTGLVPLLVTDDGQRLHQSLAIIEYLDETHPRAAAAAARRARPRPRARAGAGHRLRDPPDQQPARAELPGRPAGRRATTRRAPGSATGSRAASRWSNASLPRSRATYCHGDTPGLADCALVPQIFNAQRFKCRLDHVPNVMRVHAACMAHEAFSSTQPSACPDAECRCQHAARDHRPAAAGRVLQARRLARRHRRADDHARRRRQRGAVRLAEPARADERSARPHRRRREPPPLRDDAGRDAGVPRPGARQRAWCA